MLTPFCWISAFDCASSGVTSESVPKASPMALAASLAPVMEASY